ncbi:PEP-CTERM sorting domain-containing protein [Alteriqipengyuania sp. 357]
MKMLTGLVGLAIMTVATPAVAYTHPPDGNPGGDRGNPTEVPAPPVALLFGLAAGAVMLRRKIA